MASILITGVSTGIGRACAELFAARGWDVVGTVRDPACPEGASCPEGLPLESLDLAVRGSAAALAERVLERFGCPDVLLNNAGVLQFGPLEGLSAEDLERIYRINVFGQLELIQALLPAMRQRGAGTIVNVTSLGGTIVFPFFAGYNSTKWAMEGISEGLWHELRPFGVRVKVIEPGFVETPIWGRTLPARDAELPGPSSYGPYLRSMLGFEKNITKRTPPELTAEEVFEAVTDQGDRLRYPVAAYARAMTRAQRWLGKRWVMRFFHGRWMGAPGAEDG